MLEEINFLLDNLPASELQLLFLALASLLGFLSLSALSLVGRFYGVKRNKGTQKLAEELQARVNALEAELKELQKKNYEESGEEPSVDLNQYKLAPVSDESAEVAIQTSTIAAEVGKISEQEKESEQIKTEQAETNIAEVEQVVAGETIEPLADRLSNTRQGLFSKLKNLFVKEKKVSTDDLDQLEEILISADIGVGTTMDLIQQASTMIEENQDLQGEQLFDLVKSEVSKRLLHDSQAEFPIKPEKKAEQPYVVLVIGVNGVGKTTTVAKLASQWKSEDKKVVMAAADTFRAAAIEQLKNWGERIDVPVVAEAEQAKPATVVFSAIDQALAEEADVLLIDTAGRLHNKNNLMQELEGIRNVLKKKLDREPDETILVVDGSTGQNALQQAREFSKILDLTGLVITKLDGTAKGGILVAIKSELDIPVRYIGVGEAIDDLRIFNSYEYVEALFGGDGSPNEAAA